MSARRAQKLARRAGRKKNRLAQDVRHRVDDDVKVLDAIAQGADKNTTLTEEGLRVLGLPEPERRLALRERHLTRRASGGTTVCPQPLVELGP